LTTAAILLFLSFATLSAAGAQPEVLQPDSGAYTAAQSSALASATAELERTVGSPAVGASYRALGDRGWTSLEFATFTAGSLAGLGYETVLASAAWSDGQHVWVLVGVDVGNLTAWIPVEATPASGVTQTTLGRIASDRAGHYDTRYTQYAQTITLGMNALPIAAIRPRATSPYIGEREQYFAMGSSDPDGEIVLYVWSVDGDEVERTAQWSCHIKFETEGNHSIGLTVVDNRGARATTSLTVTAYDRNNVDPGSPGCGCGKP
jgi:hypothetical protein